MDPSAYVGTSFGNRARDIGGGKLIASPRHLYCLLSYRANILPRRGISPRQSLQVVSDRLNGEYSQSAAIMKRVSV